MTRSDAAKPPSRRRRRALSTAAAAVVVALVTLAAVAAATLLAVALPALGERPTKAGAPLPRHFALDGGARWSGSSSVVAGDGGWTPYFTPGVVVWDGGSIVGSLGVTPGGEFWTQTLALLPRACLSYFSITRGADLEDMLREAPAQVDAHYARDAAINLVVAQGGASDLKGGAAVADELEAMRRYCEGRHLAGFQVVLLTLLPRTDPAYETARTQYNDLLRTQWPAFADGLIDVAADPRIGAPGDNLDRTYYRPDQTHLNAAGCTIMAGIAAPVLESLAWVAPDLQTRLRNAGGSWGPWRPYVSSRPWRLTPGDGLKTVACQYRAGSPAATTAQASIRLDTRGPVTSALRPVRARRGARATFRYRIDDAPFRAPVQEVGIRVSRRGRTVREYSCPPQAAGTRGRFEILCDLPRGRYLWRVLARDAAGNPQAVATPGRLTVR